MRMYDIIKKKRDGYELSSEEIADFIKGYTDGTVSDEQAAALLMSVYFRGMNENETAVLTEKMACSGQCMDLSRFGELSVDKHSTGGVGDKTTLIVAPVIAQLGGRVVKMSGRGLGHTGGTADKLESIPGYRTSMSDGEFLSQVEKTGMAVVTQSGNLTPADKKLYALRDVTATVESLPLIAASVMSKKLALGARSIVLDVKVGNGAFMKTLAEAERLARSMVNIGTRCGRNTAAVLTNMDLPLGNAVGNSLEVIEAVRVLKGEIKGDLYEVSAEIAALMAEMSLSLSEGEARRRVAECISSGAAYEKMCEWIAAQGGDIRYIENTALFPVANTVLEVFAEQSGYISAMDAEQIGGVSLILGVGRERKEDAVDHSAGIVIAAKTGDYVNRGDRLCTLYTNNVSVITKAKSMYLSSLTFSDKKPDPTTAVYGVIR